MKHSTGMASVLILYSFVFLLQLGETSADSQQNTSACYQPLFTGRCRANMPVFGYDGRNCVQFVYGGCQGNDNRFESENECKKLCKGVIIPCSTSDNCAPCQTCRKIWKTPCYASPCTSEDECEGRKC